MSFPEADEFNAVHGTQFIADLMPKTPIYVAMLPESAQSVIGQPHPTGRAALKMLENEGFAWDCFIDIFDGGPTVTAATDTIRTIKEAQWLRVAGENVAEGSTMLLASGTLHNFVSCYAQAAVTGNNELLVDAVAMEVLGVERGDRVLAVAR
jgi:arginine N-succinyltransferase